LYQGKACSRLKEKEKKKQELTFSFTVVVGGPCRTGGSGLSHGPRKGGINGPTVHSVTLVGPELTTEDCRVRERQEKVDQKVTGLGVGG